MKINLDELSPVQRKIHVELPAEKVSNEFSRAYQQLGRRVRIKGFRAGKAPRSVLQGLYGDEIKGQVRSTLVEDSLGEVIKDRGLQVVSRPQIDADDIEEGHEFSFSAVFEVKPEIAVRDYLGLVVEKPNISVTEEQVDEALKRLQQSHARLEPVTERDVVERGDFVALDFVGSVDNKPFVGGKGENYLLEVGAGQALPQFDDALVGAKQGEEKNIHIKYPQTYANRELAGKDAEFSAIVREIKRKVIPPLDDEFAKDHGECASLEDLKEMIHQRLKSELKQIQDEELKEKILNRLIDSHPFTPPSSMIERQTRYLMERNATSAASDVGQSEPAPTTEETRRLMEARSIRQVQATLILERVSQLEKIEVADNQLQERVDQIARAAGERGKSVREVYSRPEAQEELRAQMTFERTLDFLLERAVIKEVDASAFKVDDAGENG